MTVLMFCAYFEPEIAAGITITNDIIDGLVSSGYQVEICAPVPTHGLEQRLIKQYRTKKYEEKCCGNLRIHRFPFYKEPKNILFRTIRYILLNLFFVHFSSKIPADVIFVDSTPPTQGLMAALVRKIKGIPVVFNLQDIFPDSMVNANMISKGGIIWKIGRLVENITYACSDTIITISQSCEDNILNKGVDKEKIEVVTNWIDLDKVCEIPRNQNSLFDDFSIDRDKFIVLYAGNFGETQGAEILLDAAQELAENTDIQFVVFGGGSRFEEFKAKSNGLNNLKVFSLLPSNRISEVYSMGDIAIITCKAGVGYAGFPSKTWSIMACNTPIIASFDMPSELEKVLAEANAGKCVRPQNCRELVCAIIDAYDNRKCTNSRRYVEENASKTRNVKKYVEIIARTKEKGLYDSKCDKK